MTGIDIVNKPYFYYISHELRVMFITRNSDEKTAKTKTFITLRVLLLGAFIFIKLNIEK